MCLDDTKVPFSRARSAARVRVKIWADNLGKELQFIAESATRRSKVIESFKQTKAVYEKGSKIMEDIADKLRTMMLEKEKAVKRIVERAEYLSYYRKPPIFENSTYDYFNADNITNSTWDRELEEQQYNDRLEQIQQFKCDDALNHKAGVEVQTNAPTQQLRFDKNDDQECQVRPYVERKPGYFRHLPLVYHSGFDAEVNFNYSVMRIATSIFDREEPLLNDIRWSEALDLVFQQNYQEDPTLLWQYFAGRTGFLRHYPGIKWSDEQYERTYDFRTRAWFLEAITSPKDVIILLDMSGSMAKYNWFIAKFLVNNILDTLGDNDYVNIYLFNNETRPLVDCFNYTLMQAHEENLRLLRESLNKYTPDTTGNMKSAFKLAFATLEHFRKDEGKSHCNQMIMFIAEGIDYDYSPAELFKTHNRTEYYTPVRVFTFLIGTSPSDEVEMVWIACANMGYYVNISRDSEIAEKVVKYLTVLSRPLNMNSVIKPDPIWTGTYADLADRRITNWLWQKYEGNQQRQVFVDYTRTTYTQYNCVFDQNSMHFLQSDSHDYEHYSEPRDFHYMTTVSLPVYDLRQDATAVLGVAGLDVPISYIKKLTMPHQIGVNGYAFILTNNGLLLLHPDHRKEFHNIIKPTFNRVDLTEVELIDDLNEPRDFNKSLLEMRDRIVRQMTGHDSFQVKIHLDNMRRVFLSRRHYFYTKIGPFSLVIAIPDNYGFYKIRYESKNGSDTLQNSKQLSGLRLTKNWKVHPEWLYCKHYGRKRLKFDTPEEELLYFLNDLEQHGWRWYKYCQPSLVTLLVLDAKATEWFEERNTNWYNIMSKYQIAIAFIATHSGLTRWRTIEDDDVDPPFITKNNKAIDEIWYKRAVTHSYANPKSFIYSVPIDTALDNETLVTGANAIFRESGSKKAAAAVVGFQFNHVVLESIFKKTTSDCGDRSCPHRCDSDELSCFVLDNNAYIIVSDEGYTGAFFGKVRPDIMKHLVENGLYRRVRFLDYQDICYLDPPSPKSKSPASRITLFLANIYGILKGFLCVLFYWVQGFLGAVVKDDPCTRAITSQYEKRAINKSLPTPCDRQRWLFSLERDTYTNTNDNIFTIPNCLWPYIVYPIPSSNLILLVVNRPCEVDIQDYPYTPDPVELKYNLSMPCYIATKNNYTRRQYITCINNHKREYSLNLDHQFCGVTWK
ncbi:voltage-dependent calcium channel subunit alpha-2/delta-3-like isoform X2 [Photinus pyralis]|uniref:voltage-dependent calcium channel subunit alpha-2/delta-3-like isoform X2 n=1 Tax=Photinus pyralis TaxID=7054 RepID=UPI0012677C51|nr:voltage-dependent calcium channel subunit alpha-2/delta-3-like isoform X2 [Photinus pyralis]